MKTGRKCFDLWVFPRNKSKYTEQQVHLPLSKNPRGHTGVCGCGHKWHQSDLLQRQSVHVWLAYKLCHDDRESHAAGIFLSFICFQTKSEQICSYFRSFLYVDITSAEEVMFGLVCLLSTDFNDVSRKPWWWFPEFRTKIVKFCIFHFTTGTNLNMWQIVEFVILVLYVYYYL